MSEPLNAPVSTIPVPRGPLPSAPAAEPVRMVEIKIDGHPLFVNEGEMIRINTKTGEYVERVK